MRTDNTNSLNVQQLNEGKDKKQKTQLQTIFAYLSDRIATASMVSVETGVPQKCITRYKRDLEKVGRLWEVKKTYCEKTGFLAWYITTDPKQAPQQQQLNLFPQ